jgi:hypothetical protein
MGFRKMLNLGNVLLAVAVLSLAVGLIARSNPIVEGLGKALFGVFLSLFFIFRFFGEENA